MGCDIHAVIETHNGDVRSDRTIATIVGLGRDYHFFGALCGVRCESVPHVSPRGRLPSGRGWTWRTEDMYEEAQHSHSWLWTEEFEAALVVYSKASADDDCEPGEREIPARYTAVLAMMKALEVNGERARFVFAFDS